MCSEDTSFSVSLLGVCRAHFSTKRALNDSPFEVTFHSRTMYPADGLQQVNDESMHLVHLRHTSRGEVKMPG